MVVLVSSLVAVAAGVGAGVFFSWRADEVRLAESTESFTAALVGRAPGSVDVPSAVPGWVLVGVAVVALLVAVVVGVAGFVSGGTASVQNTDGVQ